jgi:dUTP pyrophosphatase
MITTPSLAHCCFFLLISIVLTASHTSNVNAMIVPSSFYSRAPLYIQRLSEHAILPSRGSDFAAGLDLSAAAEVTIAANGGRAVVPTDLRIACPPGTYLRIAPRSGLAVKHGIDVGAGVVDADYRGPVGVVLFNFGNADFTVQRGDRIAQAILEQIMVPSDIVDVPLEESLPELGERGEGGFGSTGVSATNDNGSDKKSKTTATSITPSTSNDEDVNESNDKPMDTDTKL